MLHGLDSLGKSLSDAGAQLPSSSASSCVQEALGDLVFVAGQWLAGDAP